MSQTFSQEIILTRRVRRPDGARTSEGVKCRVDLAIEVYSLMRELGQRALNSKGKAATMGGGKIKVKVRMPEE